MSDKISIQGLEVWTRIGVPDDERSRAQKLEISASFEIKTAAEAAKTDDIQLTVNYFEVAQAIKAVAQKKPRKLIETLAEDLAEDLLKRFQLREIELEIRKFIMPDCRHVSLRIKRKLKKRRPAS